MKFVNNKKKIFGMNFMFLELNNSKIKLYFKLEIIGNSLNGQVIGL